MKFIKEYMIRLIFVVIIILSGSSIINAQHEIATLAEYFDLLVSGNFESASYLWHEDCRLRSSRFGIEYTDIPLKADCNSPIVRNLSVMKNYMRPPVKSVNKLSDDYFLLHFEAVHDGVSSKHDYYIYFDGDYNWLSYPQDHFTAGYHQMSTKYFNIRYEKSLKDFLNPIVLEEADKFVETMAEELGLTDEDLKLLEDKKIEYFYCLNDAKVEEITGYLVKGTFDLPSNDIISAFFPHYHEMVHFLINFKLRKLPLYTQPIMREGLAVHFAGRWGKSPSSLITLGRFLYEQQIVDLDSILNVHGFEQSSGSDVGYPVAGMFCSYLIDRLGMDKFVELYLELSGPVKKVQLMTVDEVKSIILKKTAAANWMEIKSQFEAFIIALDEKNNRLLPGKIAGETIFENENVSITDNDEWIALEFKANKDEMPIGNILFKADELLKDKRSVLFDEQYKNKLYFDGYRYGLKFDRNEAGIYDYATNHIVAKYIFSFSPSDEYYDEANQTINIKFNKSLINNYSPSVADIKIMEQ